jgi:signal peptidase II
MRAVSISRYVVYLLFAAVGCTVDLTTKKWVFEWLEQPGASSHIFWLWRGHVGFQTSLNEGALFGLGQGNVLLFTILSMAAAVAIPLWLFYAGAAVDWMLTIAMGCVTAGILGNLYDRLGLHGLRCMDADRLGEPVYAVRDFVLLQVNNSLRWPNFNVADSLLVCGAALLLWHAATASSASGLEMTKD